MFTTGVICFVLSFFYFVKTLWSNSTPQSIDPVTTNPTIVPTPTKTATVLPTEKTDTTFIESASIDATIVNDVFDISDIYETIMFDTVPMIIEYWDSSLDRIACNDTAATFFDIPVGELRKNVNDLSFVENSDPNGPNYRDLWRENLQATFDRGFSIFEYESEIAGKHSYLEVVAHRKKITSGYIVVTYIRDISADKQFHQAKEQQAMAEARSQAKSRFLAHMSHEIRTPISAVLGIAEAQLHKHKDLSQEVREAFSKIHSSSRTLIDIINDVLDISKIEAGKMTLNPKPYNLAYLLQEVTQIYAVFREGKQFEFKLSIDENLPTTLTGDELRIKQILHNLLSNAFKYTEVGAVSFTVKGKAAESGGINLVMTVQDTGVGMSKTQVGKLRSEEYIRFAEHDMPDVQGTGLGIAITRNLLELLSANMDIDSTPGVGTTITVTIPQSGQLGKLGQATARSLEKLEMISETTKLVPPSLSHGRVLVVDDVESNLYVASTQLGIFDVQVETCQTAARAIEKIIFGEEYDIIFMDILMPDIDGITATKMLRELGYTKPIVALSANHASEKIKDQGFDPGPDIAQDGFDAWISKPIQLPILQEVLVRFIN